MSFKNQVTWTRDQRAKATELDKVLFAVGVDGRMRKAGCTGCYIQTGCMTEETARSLFMFAQRLYQNMDPRKAFEEVFEPKPVKNRKPKARSKS